MTAKQKEFMEQAIRLSIKNVKTNEGGPFGAVIVKDNVTTQHSYNNGKNSPFKSV